MVNKCFIQIFKLKLLNVFKKEDIAMEENLTAFMKRLLSLTILVLLQVHTFGQDSTNVPQANPIGDTIIVNDYWLGENKIVFQNSCYKQCDAAVGFINLHDDENTSVDAATLFLVEAGGSLTELKHTGGRYLEFKLNQLSYRVDPNRIFSAAGIKASLLKQGKYSAAAAGAVKVFADTLKKNYVDNRLLLVTLHNNTPGNLSIYSYKKGNAEGNNSAKVFINPGMNPDDFVLTTTDEIFNHLKRNRINVVLQYKHAKDDGSLSIYAKKKNIPYVNVEAQHGHLNEQLLMLKILHEVIIRYQSIHPL